MMTMLDKLTRILNDIEYLQLEYQLIFGAVILLTVGFFSRNKILVRSLYGILLSLIFVLNLTADPLEDSLFLNSLIYHKLNYLFTLLFILLSLLVLIFKRGEKDALEFYFLIISLLVGAIFIMHSNNMLTLYISVEFTSFVSYILANFPFKKTAYESAIKYLIVGALTSAILLFGLGMIYVTTGSFYFSDWNTEMFASNLTMFGLLFVTFSLFFKLTIFPFYFWVPSVYQTASNDAVAVISVFPKLSVFVFLTGVFQNINLNMSHWIVGCILLSGLITVVFASIAAINQKNVRRTISFGAMVHSGILLPLFVIDSESARNALWFYGVVYGVMNMMIFYFLDVFESKKYILFGDYQNFPKKHFMIAIAYAVVLMSMVGMPPFVGFFGKFFVFSTLWQAYLDSELSMILIYLLTSVVFTVVSLYYYLKVPYNIFVKNSGTKHQEFFSTNTKIYSIIFPLIIILLFFYPNLLMLIKQSI